MQHLKSTKQKYCMHCNTDYKHYNIFTILILTASPQQYIATVEPDSVFS